MEEDEDVPSRTHWRNEISIPLDVQKFVRERCKKYNHNQRENCVEGVVASLMHDC